MSKKDKKSSKFAVKVTAIICILVLTLGLGVSTVGIEKLIDAESFSDIFAMTGEILQDNFGATDSSNQQSQSENANTSTVQGQAGNNENSDVILEIPDVEGSMSVYYFSVGQADCTLVASNGEYMLIDAGNNSDGKLIATELEKMGVDSIKYLVGTHPHEDHIGGLDTVIKSVNKVENFYMPDNEYDSATYRDVVKAAKNAKVKIVEPKIGYVFEVGEAKCEIMGVDGDNEDPNHMSIIIEVTHGENKFLFMGDAEIYNEELRLWNDIDVLKAGHHGSSTSTSDDFLEQTMPEIAVISCGEGNSYGHPHREIIKAFNDSGIKYYRTDKQGTIRIDSDGKDLKVTTLNIELDGDEK